MCEMSQSLPNRICKFRCNVVILFANFGTDFVTRVWNSQCQI